MSEVQQPETTAPDILAWREFTIRFTDPNDPVRGETAIREAFAAGWNAALASDTEAVREPDALDVAMLAKAIHQTPHHAHGSFIDDEEEAEYIAVEYRRLRESAT